MSLAHISCVIICLFFAWKFTAAIVCFSVQNEVSMPPSHMVQFGYLLAAKGFRWQIRDEHFFPVFRQRHFDHPQGNVPDPFHPPADIRSFIMSDPAFVQVDVHPCVRCRQSGLFFFIITGFETCKEQDAFLHHPDKSRGRRVPPCP